MSIKIHNIEELIEKLDFDAQWRKKEIADILLLCKNNNNPPVLLRAAFVLCSAHFEGYIKYASNAYIAFISAQNIKGKDLRIEIASIAVRKKKHQLFGIPSAKKVKITVVSDLLETYDSMLENNFYIKLSADDLVPEIDEEDVPLPTEGNPTPDVLKEISKIIGIDYDTLFQLRAPFIDSELLKPRHSVAHGERRQIRSEELNAAAEFVIEIVDKFKDSIIDAAKSNRHMRENQQV
jgi:hypothetical protein